MDLLKTLRTNWMYVVGGLLILTLCVYLYIKYFYHKIPPSDGNGNGELSKLKSSEQALKNTVKTLQNQLEHGVIVNDNQDNRNNQNNRNGVAVTTAQNGRIEAKIETLSTYYADELPESASIYDKINEIKSEPEMNEDGNGNENGNGNITIEYDEKDCEIDSNMYNLNMLNGNGNGNGHGNDINQQVDEIKSIYEPESDADVKMEGVSDQQPLLTEQHKLKIKLKKIL